MAATVSSRTFDFAQASMVGVTRSERSRFFTMISETIVCRKMYVVIKWCIEWYGDMRHHGNHLQLGHLDGSLEDTMENIKNVLIVTTRFSTTRI